MKRTFASFLVLLMGCSVAPSITIAGPTNWSDAENYAPIQQRQFCDLTRSYEKELAAAIDSRNEIKVNKTKMTRQMDLDGLLPNGDFKDWIVKVVSIKQVVEPNNDMVDGDAAIVLELWCGTQIGSGQINLGETNVWGATIDYGSREYREVSKLSSGEFAVVSGSFLKLQDLLTDQKETFYASRPLTSKDLEKASNIKYSNGNELFLAKLRYIAAAN